MLKKYVLLALSLVAGGSSALAMEQSINKAPITHITITNDDNRKRIYAYNRANNEEAGSISYSSCRILSLYVYEKYRNQGIGTQLVARALKDLDTCSQVTLTAAKGSVNFWKQRGALFLPPMYARPSPEMQFIQKNNRIEK